MDDRKSAKRSELYQSDLERHLFEFEERHGDSEPGNGLSERIRAKLDQLPELYREVIVLRVREGLPYHEIAERLGLPLGTVKSRLHRARALVRRLLHELEEQIESLKTDEHVGENS